MAKALLKHISYYLPQRIVSNDDLTIEFPEWKPEKVQAKTGIINRHIAAKDECASDLAEKAAIKLFETNICAPADVEFLLFCTQSPDYFLPTTACLLQDRLNIPKTAGALDFNLGCSGYVYGLSLAKGLIETEQVRNVLLITAETYSKYIDPEDVSSRSIFGDGAAASFIIAEDSDTDLIGPFVFGTDGSGKNDLIVKGGAMRFRMDSDSESNCLYMNGPEIFIFTIKNVANAVYDLLKKSNLSLDDVDHFVFHQANKYMLEHLRDKIGIPADKFHIDLQNYGNTVSSTIPIVLSNVILDDDDSIHNAWASRFKIYDDQITLYHFRLGEEAMSFINEFNEKERLLLLTDFELLKQEINGLHVIEEAKIERSLLVTSHYSNVIIRNLAVKNGTKILPKPLASEVNIILTGE